MGNPFEDETGSFAVLENQEGQHSLWPSFVAVPRGWKSIFGPETRGACLEFVENNWTDMRPNSLRAAMEADSESSR
ncbi:MAG: MbtH family NRPS accessory protein [Acidobacteria bacterium]|nr:MbtH family NRPS accessory protein [Acidobacteriota bacterium]